ncbi:MAG: protoporphyrinogen oxidase [Candidatus Latescibacteria bacterium]|nr:protoporphyrinogen oxidase [Candidatus Latescibacterota bacterium]
MIGAGITGLSAAHRLQELQDFPAQIDLKILEASERPGGTIETVERDGFLVEKGPDSFLSSKPWLLNLCKRLKIIDRVVQTNSDNRRSFVVYQGALHPLPEGFLMMAPTRLRPFITSSLFSWAGKLRMGLDLVLPRAEPSDDESVASFVRRRLGREALERVVQPLIGGIYTGDPENLSLRATMPRFLEMEEKHGSVIRAMWREQRQAAYRAKSRGSADSGARYSMMVSFDRGMQTIVDELVRILPDQTLQLGRKATGIRRLGTEWQVTTSAGAVHTADDVMIALPSYKAANLVKDTDPELARRLSGLSYASSAIVNFAYDRSDIPHALDGFGFVVPEIEGRNIIAGSFSSIKFPNRAPDGKVLLRAFVGGAMQAHLYDMDDEEIEHLASQELLDLMGIQADPLWSIVTRWPLSMPQYLVGHMQRTEQIQTHVSRHTGLTLMGNAYAGVGLPDCVRSGEDAAERVISRLQPQEAVLQA